MANLNHDLTPHPSFTQQASTGIASALESLAQNKIRQKEIHNKQKWLSGMGLNADTANFLSHQKDADINKFLSDNVEGLNYGNQNQQNPNEYQQRMEEFTNQQVNPAQGQFQTQGQGQPSIPELVQRAYMEHPGLDQQISPEDLGRLFEQQNNQLNQNQGSQNNQTNNGGIRPKGSSKPNEFQIAEYKEQLKEQAAERKESKEFAKTLNKDYKAAKENNLRLDKMEKLIQTGRLSPALFSSALNTLEKGVFGHGINLKSVLTPETQEFDKLSSDFVKGAKNIFGSRITDNDLKVYLNTIPNISQSNEAKMAVIDNLRIFNKGVEARQLAAKGIIRVNNGKIPNNFEELVDQVASSRLDELANEFRTLKNREVAPAAGYSYKPGQYQQIKEQQSEKKRLKEQRIKEHQERKIRNDKIYNNEK